MSAERGIPETPYLGDHGFPLTCHLQAKLRLGLGHILINEGRPAPQMRAQAHRRKAPADLQQSCRVGRPKRGARSNPAGKSVRKYLDWSNSMAMTSSETSKVALAQCWQQSACPWFSTTPPTQRRATQGDPSWPSRMIYTTLSRAATSSPVQRSCAVSYPGFSTAPVGIAMEDWDLLFGAVMETLARVVSEKEPAHAPAFRLETPQDVVVGCMKALDQLRRSVPNAHPRRLHLGDA